jgi:hypothetical protein
MRRIVFLFGLSMLTGEAPISASGLWRDGAAPLAPMLLWFPWERDSTSTG